MSGTNITKLIMSGYPLISNLGMNELTTHSVDNPPPKVVQGYKVSLFIAHGPLRSSMWRAVQYILS